MTNSELARTVLAAHRDERGQMGFLLMLSILVVFMFLALAFDVGLWAFDHRTAQTQADAAALAAVYQLPALPSDTAKINAAIQAADDWLVRNGADPAELCEPHNLSDGNGDGELDTVRVCVRRASPIVFSGLANVAGIFISAAATARVHRQPSPYALMAMHETACNTLYLNGGPIVNLTGGGGSYTRSLCGDGALHVQGSSSLNTGQNDVMGDSKTTGGGVISPGAYEGADYLPDPFAYLAEPNPAAFPPRDYWGVPCTSTVNINSPMTLDPGTYCHELRINAMVTLNPGVYIFRRGMRVGASGGLTGDVNGNGVLESNEEVLLYFTCTTVWQCNGAQVPDVRFEGGSILKLRGIDSPAYERIVLWVDRTAHPDSLVRFRGGSFGGLEGRIYGLTAYFDIGGDPGLVYDLNMSMVGGRIQFSGNATFNLPYDLDLAPPILVYALIE